MFNATLHRLPPPPPTFASSSSSNNTPLRLASSTSDTQRPLPTGECRFLLPYPSSSRCTCQSFHHNRGIPGTTCDCGHQACYHAIVQEENTTATAAAAAFENRIRQLETEVRLERQMREREIRNLRDALQPFYGVLEGVRRKVGEMEDRVEGNWDEVCRVKERVVALDECGMALERRVDDVEGSTSKRRRVERVVANANANGDERRLSEEEEEASVSVSVSVGHSHGSISGPASAFIASRSISPTGQHITGHGTLEYGAMAAPPEREGPRSSGILNPVQLQPPRSPPYTPSYDVSRRVSPPREVEEARSSGFLALDLAEGLARRGRGDGNGIRNPNVSAPPGMLASPESSSGDDGLGKRKRGHDAGMHAVEGVFGKLGVLADVSAVSAMAR